MQTVLILNFFPIYCIAIKIFTLMRGIFKIYIHSTCCKTCLCTFQRLTLKTNKRLENIKMCVPLTSPRYLMKKCNLSECKHWWSKYHITDNLINENCDYLTPYQYSGHKSYFQRVGATFVKSFAT